MIAQYTTMLHERNEPDIADQLTMTTQSHHTKILTSSVYHLALAMWPSC